ncbi:MAG: DNA primase [bacterium]|nr:DNA primase [bacterium]
MSDSNVDQVKERTDIAQLIGEQVRLKRVGGNYKGLCPFHNEKTPSFIVTPSRQMFHCFGCGKSGDVFTWVMEKEGMTFAEALRVLAQRAGVTLAFEKPEHREEKEQLRSTLDTTAEFYKAIFEKTTAGKVARDYLLGRGLTEETISAWRIGYVPPTGTPLIEKAKNRGVTVNDLIQTGIVAQGSRGYYERFFGRVIFPLTDMHGTVVGLAGRILKEDPNRPAAKYINSPETVLYRKSKILYGMDRARDMIRKEDLAIIVEGYTDVMGSHQAGITNAVATSGTALTEEHLQIIKRFTENIAFAFDGDTAGDNANRRAIDMAIAAGFSATVVLLPDGQDPADVAIKTPDAWRQAIAHRRDAFTFLLQRALKKYPKLDTQDKKSIAGELLPLLAKIPEAITRGDYLQRLGQAVGIESRYLNEEVKRLQQIAIKTGASTPSPAKIGDQNVTEKKNLVSQLNPIVLKEERLLTLLLVVPGALPYVLEHLPSEVFSGNHTRDLFNEYIRLYNAQYRKEASFDFSKLRENLSEELRRLVDIFLLAIEVEQEEGLLDQPDQEVHTLLKELLQSYLRQCLNKQSNKLEQADPRQKSVLMQEIDQLREKLIQAESLTTS